MMKRKSDKSSKASFQEERKNLLKEKVNKGYQRLQSGWAQWMLRRTVGISPNKMRLILAAFVLVIGSYCAWLTYAGITGKSATFFSVTPIKKPSHTTTSDSLVTAMPKLSDSEYQRIRRFRGYMDSLAGSPTGKRMYDSIIRHRPGLMDSILYIEKYYGQHKNK